MGADRRTRRDARRAQRRLPKRAWARLYADFHPQVERYFAARVAQRADAEDLAMQVFEELAYRQVPRDPEPYIRAIARNMLSRHRRNRIRESAALGKLLAEVHAEDGTSHLLRSEESRADQIEAIAATLSARQRELARLKFGDNLSVGRIAVRLRCSQAAVYKRIQRLRRRVNRGIPSRRGRVPARR
jgi:RNA polymerase sigma factor (sigma-70 family)